MCVDGALRRRGPHRRARRRERPGRGRHQCAAARRAARRARRAGRAARGRAVARDSGARVARSPCFATTCGSARSTSRPASIISCSCSASCCSRTARGALLWTVTAFTAGHSVTLSLAALGIARFPSAPIELAIAATILVLALELRAGRRPAGASWLRRWPWLVAFAFGLLHGFGFAGALAEIGLPQQEIPLALFSFNVGIELGQLAFVGARARAGAAAAPAARARAGRARARARDRDGSARVLLVPRPRRGPVRARRS